MHFILCRHAWSAYLLVRSWVVTWRVSRGGCRILCKWFLTLVGLNRLPPPPPPPPARWESSFIDASLCDTVQTPVLAGHHFMYGAPYLATKRAALPFVPIDLHQHEEHLHPQHSMHLGCLPTPGHLGKQDEHQSCTCPHVKRHNLYCCPVSPSFSLSLVAANELLHGPFD